MNKQAYLLTDQVVHWNIVPSLTQKQVHAELWGASSSETILGAIQSYFEGIGQPMNWMLTTSDPISIDKGNISPTNTSLNHVFATWHQYKEGANKAWRIRDMAHAGQANSREWDNVPNQDMESSDVFIIQDWGFDIRDQPISNLTASLQNKWVIYRPYPPISEGALWNNVQKSFGSNTIMLLRANDLRKLNSSISKGLSWELTIEDIINEIYFKKNIALFALRTVGYVIISFGCTATLMIHNDLSGEELSPEISFLFDPNGIEGYWESNHPGYLPGDMDILSLLLCNSILSTDNPEQVSFENAIRAHLLSRRGVYTIGAEPPSFSLPLSALHTALDVVYGKQPTLKFTPVELEFSIFKRLFDDKIPQTDKKNSGWSLLGITNWDLYSLARQIARHGPEKALHGWNIPIARYNHLITVDRKEIEFIQHLQSLITEYLQQRNNQLLSIAVFGAPGSGKSFSIKQLARSLSLPEYDIKDVTFNLSQLDVDNPSELYQAFHVVRDISLSGKTPLVFWDEFDSNNLSWLRFFLAPMQDGEFQEGQLNHYIGKSIFVFAGGTCSSMEQFEKIAQHAVNEKGPDFLSRIKGFLNVMGPNPILPITEKTAVSTKGAHVPIPGAIAKNADPEYIIRRAILIHSLLKLGYKHLFKDDVLQIDDGVLHAFLLVPVYKHGTRSMETIFRTSQLHGKDKYYRSYLPPEPQMNLHVDGQEFYDLMSQQSISLTGGQAFYHLINDIDLDERIIRKMAAGIHTMYSLVYEIEDGRSPLTITREEFLAHYSRMQTLPTGMPHDEVSQNYHNARKIPEKLAVLGYSVMPMDVNIPSGDFADEEREKISRLEHIRWVRHHIDAGWRFDPSKNKARKLHDGLVAWDEEERENAETIYGLSYIQNMGLAPGQILNEHYRDLDRAVSASIPWVLEIVGYKIAKM